MLIRLKMKEIIYQQKGNQMTHEKHKLIHVNVYIYILIKTIVYMDVDKNKIMPMKNHQGCLRTQYNISAY